MLLKSSGEGRSTMVAHGHKGLLAAPEDERPLFRLDTRMVIFPVLLLVGLYSIVQGYTSGGDLFWAGVVMVVLGVAGCAVVGYMLLTVYRSTADRGGWQ